MIENELRDAENMASASWNLASLASVSYFPGERETARRTTEWLFGRTLGHREYSGLAGAPNDAKVQVGTLGGDLCIEMRAATPCCYHGVWVVRRIRSELALVNEVLRIHETKLQRKGLGLRIFLRQLEHSKALGVRRIRAAAGRRENENGYYTWPRFGFDGPIPERIKRMLPHGLAGADTVLDLMESEDGRRWWRRHGVTVDVTFDVLEPSRSWTVIRDYLRIKLASNVASNAERLDRNPPRP